MSFSVGSLVRCRGREWVVLPESDEKSDLLVLRPLGASDDEVVGVYTPLETVEPAEFAMPDPAKGLGDHRSCVLLRDAVRLSFRSGAGPFRCLARLNVEPRSYQFVPLLMALRQDPVRLLVADDVGVGKTVESLLIARELLDRGEIRRIAVLCPPPLAEQWQRAMTGQFHIDAECVLPGTAARLERSCGLGESLFDRYPFVIVSTDYIKSDRRRFEFLRAAPEFIIVDEAHTCAPGGRASQQRNELLKALSQDDTRHLVLVTATPHSGKEEAFRALLGLLDPSLEELPQDLSGDRNRRHRESLAKHLVQRRRGDLVQFLEEKTPFPRRDISEQHYALKNDYRRFIDKVLEYCKEKVKDETGGRHHQRIRWWSALALLRSLSSSPAAAAETLRNRAAAFDTETPEQADEIGRRQVLDVGDEATEGVDAVFGARTDEDKDGAEGKRLKELAAEVEGLSGKKDAKLERAISLVKGLLKDGYSPILFCRFIPTVKYVTEALRESLHGVDVSGVDGTLPPAEREARINDLSKSPKRVLVCTDCLSEGVDLQHGFDAVMHYDLAWNPTRHEQREGRVDRYGQPRDSVRTLTYYGQDNPIDGIVLKVLLRKHKSIHKALGITVPVPMDTDAVVEAIMQSLMLHGKAHDAQQNLLPGFEQYAVKMNVEWDAAMEREKKSRTIFAQHSIRTEEILPEIQASREAIGGELAVESFVTEALQAFGCTVAPANSLRIDPSGTSGALRDAIGHDEAFVAAFAQPASSETLVLTRTHPVVEGLANFVLEGALDSTGEGPARRCGVIRTDAVAKRTTLLLMRLRYHIIEKDRTGVESPLLAEEQLLAGFEGSPTAPRWLDEGEFEKLLSARPGENTPPELAAETVARVIEAYSDLAAHLEGVVRSKADALLEAHRRVRKVASVGVRNARVDPHLPGDLLGLFVYLPVPRGGAR